MNEKLFEPVKIGAFSLRNRIAMAPLTRCRSDIPGFSANVLMAEHYRLRATAGLIISEGTQISPQGQGFYGSPGIYSDEQIAGWKLVTDAVHAKGGCIVAQLWHVGRVSHPSLQPGGALPVAPSAIKPNGKVITESGPQDVETPRALSISEITAIVEDHAVAAKNAIKAGFDGVEIHGANGYLIDQFLRDGSNKREDAYGGGIENRARFALEVVDAVCTAVGKDRVGIRISPVTNSNDMSDSNPQAIFGYLVEQLSKRGIAFLEIVEGHTRIGRDVPGFDYAWARKAFGGAYVANNLYTREMALDAVETGRADLISFGRPFISNPDLVEKLLRNVPLTPWDQETFYKGGKKGYLDYPTAT